MADDFRQLPPTQEGPLDPNKKVWGPPKQAGGRDDAKLRPPTQGQAMVFDPNQARTVYEFLEATASHSRYGTYALEKLSHSPFISAIIRTRINQAKPFFRPTQAPNTPGYRAMRKDRRKSPTSIERAEGDRLTKLLWTCGDFQGKVEKFQRDFFPVYATKLLKDSLTYDAGCSEIEPSNGGRPRAWRAVDASSIYRTVPKDPWGVYASDESAFVQVKGDIPRAYWPIELMSFWIRNPQTTMSQNNYGYPELAELVSILTGLTFGWEHNVNAFKNGMPRGITAIIGSMSPEVFTGLQQQMMYAAQGTQNAFRQTLINMDDGGDVKIIPFGHPNREMEYNEWMNFCYFVMCSVFQIDPSEVGIYFNTGGGGQSLFPDSPSAKYQFSRDKGFIPIMFSLQDELTRYIVEQLNEDFDLVFTGLDSKTDEERLKLSQMRTSTISTINEERASLEMEPRPDGDVIRDPIWYQSRVAAQQAVQMAAQQQQAAQPAAPAVAPVDDSEWYPWATQAAAG
jgi:hypothetical protein